MPTLRLLLASGFGVSLLIGVVAAVLLLLKPSLVPLPGVATTASPSAAAPRLASATPQLVPTPVPQSPPRATAAAPRPTPGVVTPPAGAQSQPQAQLQTPAQAQLQARAQQQPQPQGQQQPARQQQAAGQQQPAGQQPPLAQPQAQAQQAQLQQQPQAQQAQLQQQAQQIQQQPRAQQQPQPQAAAQILGGRILLEARFTDPQAGWLEKPPFAHWADGAYRLVASEPQHFVAVPAPVTAPSGQNGQNADLIVSATLRKVGGPPGGGYGVIVHNQDSSSLDAVNQTGNFYVLEVGDQGDVGVWRRNGDSWFDVLPWTASPAVRIGGSPNDLLVQVAGDRLVFQVNGVQVWDGQIEASPDSHGVGLFVGGDTNEVALDHFSVQTPD